jgi:hypothetical protein
MEGPRAMTTVAEMIEDSIKFPLDWPVSFMGEDGELYPIIRVDDAGEWSGPDGEDHEPGVALHTELG